MTDKELKELGKKLNIDFEKYPFDQFKEGMQVELEHSDVTNGDPVMTAKIVMAHLRERTDYYTLLRLVEDAPKKAEKKKS